MIDAPHLTLVVIIFYVASISIAGLLASRGKTSLEDFHLAGRSLNFALLTITICATVMGASSTLGMAGLGFSNGLPGAWWLLSGTIGLGVVSLWLAQRVRVKGSFTLPEMMGSFYGQNVRIAAAFLITISWIGVIAAQIVASGKVLSYIFIGQEQTFMCLSAIVFMIYTAHGGQRSVVRTDLIQFAVIVCGLLVLLWNVLSTVGTAPLEGLTFPTSTTMNAGQVLSMILVVGSTYLIGPDVYSRLLSAKDPKIAKISALASSIILIPLAIIVTLLGIYAKALMPSLTPEQAIPALMTSLLSPISESIVATALLAAFMSSADTTLMTSSSILTMDIFRSIRPKSSVKELMIVSRACVIVIGSVALVTALANPAIIKTLLMAYTIFVSGLLIPALAGFYKDKLNITPFGALAGLIGGGVTAIVIGQSQPLAGIAVSAFLLITISRLPWFNR